MKMKAAMIIGMFFVHLVSVSGIAAKEVVVYGLDAMPLCGTIDGKPAGITVDILQEATRYGAPPFVFRMDVPWIRAQMQVQQPGDEHNAIIPFSRSPQREDKFKWVGELIQTQFRLYSFGRSTPLKSVEDAQKANVGVVRGHAIIPLLQQRGITRIDETRNAEVNAQKLQHKRLDAIAESDFIALYNWRQLGLDTADLQEGLAIAEPTRVYIATGLHFPEDLAKSIAVALEKMHKDGKMREILNRWR